MFIDVNSIKLPDSYGQKRELRSVKSHLDGSRLDAYDLEQYDYDTVFYDIFLDHKNLFLYTIGPPFLNLEKSLFPILCRINNDGKRYPLQIREYFDHKIAIGRISLNGLTLHDENSIELDFNGRFQWSGGIELNKHKIKPVILTTIQKENRMRWIKEWMGFYSRNYNIDQTVIYDNSSSNRDDLKSVSDDNLLIIAWDFKYGPIRSHANQFCQLGSLNHCRLKFGWNNTIMNFDIDELLCANKSKLQRYINRYNLVLFNGYRVPFIKPASDNYSYADFSFRDRNPQQGGRKYFYIPAKVIVNDVHNALLKKHQLFFYKKLIALYFRLNNVHIKSRICGYLLNFISIVLRLKVVPIDEAYFLHYTGITNNWKAAYWDRTKEITPSDKHVNFNILDLS